MIALTIYSISLLISSYVIAAVKDRWQQLMAWASLSNKVSMMMLLIAHALKDANLIDVFFFYAILNSAGVIFMAFYFSKEGV
uniref:PH regulation protein F n=1 Tax=Pseudothermotoga hypogea TaxID=57487 RepID=A0A832MNH0_9THEM